MKLYFENSYGDWREIADCNSSDVYTEIDKFIKKANKKNIKPFKSAYVRSWESDGFIHYDVGSWTEFFHLQVDPTKGVK